MLVYFKGEREGNGKSRCSSILKGSTFSPSVCVCVERGVYIYIDTQNKFSLLTVFFRY